MLVKLSEAVAEGGSPTSYHMRVGILGVVWWLYHRPFPVLSERCAVRVVES
jgi:hypothetical protein